ncbi:NAD(P)-dependent oxidoreductase [Sodalis praecaptivus]|uniref:NAD(P)-dependent oxidoreductase n=1 Tax=Sodalis praecaptivus TaxID=1239307 RepID=UPI0027EC30BD|nr:NAD(P)-dependent oxidoreductase [Sodalis praecaptivus]CAJ0994093.1 Glyoxylate/hydroxypyruvate reductase B [Sodalis praecaptivus]
MRVLFAAPEDAWGGIYARFCQALPEMEFVAASDFRTLSLANFDAMIPTMTPVDAALLQSADRLKLIQQVGAGLEGVDIAAARARGIAVANVPSASSGNADSVAELAIYLMLGLARNAADIPRQLQLRQLGRPIGLGLMGKTVGLVGLGGIGKALARRLTAFGMRIIGIKRTVDEAFAARYQLDWLGTLAELATLLGQADFVVLSLPDSAQIHHLINAQSLSYCKPGSFLINVGRGGLVEKHALELALISGQLAGAGLDVFWQEPPDSADSLFQQNVIATPHIGGVTDIYAAGNIQAVCDNLRRLQQGEPLWYLA